MTTVAGGTATVTPAGYDLIVGSNVVNVVGPDRVGVTMRPAHATPDGLVWVSDWTTDRELTKTADLDDAIAFADQWIWENA